MPLFGPPNIEKMKAKKDVNGLLRLLSKSKDLEQTKKAIAALGEIGDPAAVPPLIGILQYEYFSMDMLDMGTDAYFKIKNANNDLRTAAAWALGYIGDARALPALRKITESSVPGFFFDGSDSLERAAKSAIASITAKNTASSVAVPKPKPQAAAPAVAPKPAPAKAPLPARLPGPIPAHTYLHDGNLKEGPGAGAVEFQAALEHWNNQRYTDALACYKKALTAGLTSVYEAAAHSNMGKIYLMQDNVADAVDHFIKALWLNPITASVAYGCAAHLALIYEQLGMMEDTRTAVAEAQQALQLINTIMSAEAAQKVKDTVKRVYPQGLRSGATPAATPAPPKSSSTPAPAIAASPQDELSEAI
jgi:HEAT repeat protein